MNKRQNVAKGTHQRVPFSDEEDIMLVKLIQRFGTDDWKKISNNIPHRNARQCKERWNNFLCPKLNKNPWTEAEDALLLEKYKIFGSQWKKISAFFDRRSHIAVRNRMAMLKRHMNSYKAESSESTCSSPDIDTSQEICEPEKTIEFVDIVNSFDRAQGENDPANEFSFRPYFPTTFEEEIEMRDFTSYRIQCRCSIPEYFEPYVEF